MLLCCYTRAIFLAHNNVLWQSLVLTMLTLPFFCFFQVRAKDAPVVLVGTHADDKRCTKDYLKR